MVDGPAAFGRSGLRDHHYRAIARISWQENRVPGFGKRRPRQRVMPARHGTRRTFAVDPRFLILHDFLTRDVVTDEINQPPGHAGQHFLEGFQHQRINQQMVHRGEVSAERHVVDIGIRFRRSEWCVNQFLVVRGERRAPLFELALEILELILRQDIAKPTRSAVAQESDVPVAQPEHLGGTLHLGLIG